MRATTATLALAIGAVLATARCTRSDPNFENWVVITGVESLFANVERGQRGVPIFVALDNRASHDIELQGVDLAFVPDDEAFSWRLGSPLPQTLPAESVASFTLFATVGLDAPLGPTSLNVSAVFFDSTERRAFIAEPTLFADVLTVQQTAGWQDADSDGLDDALELALGSDPNDPDSDDDMLDDGLEAPDGAAIDSDQDGTPDLLDDDSDDGGVPDVLEAGFGTMDPTSPDDDLTIDYNLLVVDDTTDDLEPGTVDDASQAGPTLSLREALTVAANHNGPDRITFDPTVFVSGTVIDITGAAAGAQSVLPEISDDDTFIDGNDVKVHWNLVGSTVEALIHITATRAAVRGLTFDLSSSSGMPNAVRGAVVLDQAQRAVVVGSTFQNLSSSQAYAIIARQSSYLHVYRTNVGSRDTGGRGMSILDSIYPVVSRSRLETTSYCLNVGDCAGGLVFENTISSRDFEGLDLSSRNIVALRNDVGFSGGVGIFVGWTSSVTMEENYVHDNVGHGIQLRGGSTYLYTSIRRNSITRNGGAPITFDAGMQGGILPPAVVTVTATSVSGTHNGPDGVEIDVFSDPDDEAEVYLGTTTLSGGTWFLDLPTPIEPSYNVTATATDAMGNTSLLSQPVPGP